MEEWYKCTCRVGGVASHIFVSSMLVCYRVVPIAYEISVRKWGVWTIPIASVCHYCISIIYYYYYLLLLAILLLLLSLLLLLLLWGATIIATISVVL